MGRKGRHSPLRRNPTTADALEASREGVVQSLYAEVARTAPAPDFIFVPELAPSIGDVQCPDLPIAVLQLHRWGRMLPAEIASAAGAGVRQVEAILSRFRPVGGDNSSPPIHHAREEPDCAATLGAMAPFRQEALPSAVSCALALGLSPGQVAALYGLPPKREVYDWVGRHRPAFEHPVETQRRCQSFLGEYAERPGEARKHLDETAKEALRGALAPAFELQDRNFAWVSDLLSAHLPVDRIRREGPNATVLILGPGDGRELYFLRRLLPEAHLVGVDREITPQGVLNEIQSDAVLVQADLAQLGRRQFRALLSDRTPAAVIARHAFAIDPAVPRTCAEWADRMSRSGGAFLASTYMNFERLLLEAAMKRRGVEIRTSIYTEGPRHGKVLPGSGSRSDHFTVTLAREGG